MGFFGRMFGSSESGEKIIDGAIRGIDKLFHTDEEKADEARAAKRDTMAVYMEWMKSTSGSRVARRFLALIVTIPWSFAHVMSMLLDAIAPFISGVENIKVIINNEVVERAVMSADKFAAAADSLSENAHANNELVGVVLLFYFGGPVASEAMQGLVGKWIDRGKQK